MSNKDIHTDDWLSKLPKDSGFKVPVGYFDSVEDQFSARLRAENLSEDAGFKVPEGYFDTLEDLIVSKVELEQKGKVIPLRTRILRMSSIAAVIAFLLTLYFNPIVITETEPSSEEIAAWIEDNMETFDADDIINSFDEDLTLDDSFFDNTLENTSIEQYLDEDDTFILIQESQGLFDQIN